MAKRRRNNIGQFIPSISVDQKAAFFTINFWQRIIAIIMALFFFLLLSPWITLAIKSKQLKYWVYSLLKFFADHFISEDELENGAKCKKNQGDI